MQSISPWAAFFLGMAAAFAIIICWKLWRKHLEPKQSPAAAPREAKASASAAVPVAAFTTPEIANRGQFTAAVAAAIATAMGTEPQGLRIRSIRRLGAASTGDRTQFVAAVSAALATAMGTEPQGLRIRSIRRLGAAPIGGRAQFVAAVSAALATAMGTEPQGLRIHSIKAI